ncbi:hypothetical protein DV738_g3145, partial [Chaetothyriales sp. CBS 135597]
MKSIRTFLQWMIISLLCELAHANSDKIVFSAPAAEALPSDASIDNLLLPTLSEQNSSVRTLLNASFPTDDSTKGTQTWLLLEQLIPGRRHQSTTTDELDQIRSRRSQRLSSANAVPTTFLFLQVFAKADYYALDSTMMAIVPPVQVDLILDPYLLNVLPTTLLSTVGFILAIAVVGWLSSGWIIKSLLRPLASGIEYSEHKKRE